jgi:hypothetical protein
MDFVGEGKAIRFSKQPVGKGIVASFGAACQGKSFLRRKKDWTRA